MTEKANDTFFEGKDFKDGIFRALIPKYYPPEYQRYIEKETSALREKLAGAPRVLEAGVGIGRLVPELAPIVGEFIGVDNAQLMLEKAQEQSAKFQNTKIQKVRLEKLSKTYPKNYFTHSLCIWNTLGNVNDEVTVLKELEKVTEGSIFVTVYLKGTLEQRKNWYRTVGVEIADIDGANEIFFSQSGLKSKSYSLEEIENLARRAGLQIAENRVLGGVILYVELKKRQSKS
jgi:SAM-dependent methyltransferase